MKSLKFFLFLSLLFIVPLLAACFSPDSGATATPPANDPAQQPTPTLQSTTTPFPTATLAVPSEPSPTVTPVSEPPPAPTPTAVPTIDDVPIDWDGVLAWLSIHWQDDPTAVTPIINALDKAGWIDTSLQQIGGNYVEFMLVDLSGNTTPEWIVTLHPLGAAPLSTPRGERLPGNLVIIGDEGVIFQVYPGAPQADKIAPLYIGIADLTNDGFYEVAIETLTCGANTCYGKYNIMSYHHGYLADIATADMQDKVNPTTSIAVEVFEPVKTFFLEYTDGDNMTGIRRQAEWAWQNGTFEQVRLDVVDERIPTDLTELETWLTGFYMDNEMQRGSAEEWLFAGRWMSGFMGIIATDMDGDGENEWIVPYYLPDAPVQEIPGFHPVQPGGLWIVNSSGIVHKAEDHLRLIPGSPKQALSKGILDMTSDGRLDILIEGLVCGSDTCSGTYELLSGHNGPVRNLLGEDHELSISSRINPIGKTMKPGSVMLAYQTADGVQDHDTWLWNNAAETLYRLAGAGGGFPTVCSITIREGVTTYTRPSTEAAVFSTVGYLATPEMRTADGWLGFDPAVAQAGNVGVFRMRWVHESDVIVTGDCTSLLEVIGPQPGVCYAMIYIDTPVYEMPDMGTAVLTNLSAADYAPAFSRSGDAWLQIDAGGGDLGWVSFNAAGLNGPCDDLPESG